MTTTTIRLPEDLKDRVAAAAERAGTTAHNVIVSAIAQQAERRYAAILASGKTISWSDMRKHLEDRMAGKPSPRPRARKLAR
ncbi:MAG: CopG family transcriptional regulator [Burkholderiales bacterium]